MQILWTSSSGDVISTVSSLCLNKLVKRSLNSWAILAGSVHCWLLILKLHGIKPVRLNGLFDSKCTRPETSNLYQSFTILINTSTGIIVDLNNLRFKWHNSSRHQTVKYSKLISQKMRACRQHNHVFTKVVTPSVNAYSNISLKWMDFRSATYTRVGSDSALK